MLRPILAMLLVLAAAASHAQGIRSVTRRTTTLERQQPARQFFDAAGVDVTGSGASTANGAGAAGPAYAGQARPAAAPMLVSKPPVAPRTVQARPYILGTVKPPAATNGTRTVAVPKPAATPAQPAARNAAAP